MKKIIYIAIFISFIVMYIQSQQIKHRSLYIKHFTANSSSEVKNTHQIDKMKTQNYVNPKESIFQKKQICSKKSKPKSTFHNIQSLDSIKMQEWYSTNKWIFIII